MAMRTVYFASCVAVFLIMPGGRAADLPVAPSPRPAGFTAEKAKQALIGLMETRNEAPVCRADIKTFGEVVPEVDENNLGLAYWGPFTLDLASMRYRFSVGGGKPGGPGGFWRAEYEGAFELQNGKWVALPPKATLYAHGR